MNARFTKLFKWLLLLIAFRLGSMWLISLTPLEAFTRYGTVTGYVDQAAGIMVIFLGNWISCGYNLSCHSTSFQKLLEKKRSSHESFSRSGIVTTFHFSVGLRGELAEYNSTQEEPNYSAPGNVHSADI